MAAYVQIMNENHVIVGGIAYHTEPAPKDGVCAGRCAFACEGACDFDYAQVGCMARERSDGREIVWVKDTKGVSR